MEDSQEALTALGGHCSAIDNDTLYVLSDSKLLSLPLKKNATVSEETAPPQNVTEPACVKAGEALYVIGGSGTPDGYSGVQRYVFANSSWETLSPPVDVLRTRTNHSVAYLEDSKEILVYAGSTDNEPSLLSSQTFLLSTQSPYIINSFTSNAPPANEPILQRWNSSHAVMVGGETTNTGVWLFGAEDGWSQLGTNLSAPVDPSTRGILIDGSDGSKVLQLYDMSASPNTVSNVVLLNAGGQVAPTGKTVDGSSSPTPTTSTRKRKRDLTLDNWPTYNSTNAPTSTRTDCSIAQNSDGLVVMAGGNADEPIILYDRDKNSWVDPDDFFGVKQQIPLKPSSTSSATPTASRTAEPSASSSAASPSDGLSAHDRMMRTLGITLGVLLGIAAVFIIALLLLRWRKMKAKRKAGYQQEKNEQDPDRMSFADRGASFMKEAGMSVEQLAPPNRDWAPGKDHNAHSSLAIITGKYNPSRNANHQPKASFESTAALVKKKNGTASEKFEMMDIGDKSGNSSKLAVPGVAALNNNSLDPNTRAERKRSSGWSKYFATTQPTGPNGVSHIPSVYVKPGLENSASSRESEYSNDGAASQTSRISTSVKVPPLDIDFAKIGDGHRLSKVATGSPHYFNSQDDFARRGSVDVAEGQRGLIVDPRRSQATSISSYGNRSTLDSTATSEFYNESGHTPWTPMSASGQGVVARDIGSSGTGGHERRTSSVYTATSYDPSGRRPSRGKGTGFFPGAGTNYVKPKTSKLGHNGPASPGLEPPKLPFAAKAGDFRDSTASDVTVFPGGKEVDDDLDWARPPKAPFAGNSKAADVRDSTASDITVFPSGLEDDNKENVKETKPANSDMSWVKLG